MRTRPTVAFVAVAVTLALSASAQQPQKAPTADEMIAMAVERARPGPEHKLLEALTGTFKQEITWSFPGMPPLKHSGTSENRWILGGRFLQCSSVGDGPARPFEGLTIYGYDTRKKQYFALGIDTTGTYYVTPHGTYAGASRSFILKGEELSEIGDGTFKYTMTIRAEGPDRHVIDFVFEFPGRDPMKVLEIVHTRR